MFPDISTRRSLLWAKLQLLAAKVLSPSREGEKYGVSLGTKSESLVRVVEPYFMKYTQSIPTAPTVTGMFCFVAWQVPCRVGVYETVSQIKLLFVLKRSIQVTIYITFEYLPLSKTKISFISPSFHSTRVSSPLKNNRRWLLSLQSKITIFALSLPGVYPGDVEVSIWFVHCYTTTLSITRHLCLRQGWTHAPCEQSLFYLFPLYTEKIGSAQI